jgi:hypothetical protein
LVSEVAAESSELLLESPPIVVVAKSIE